MLMNWYCTYGSNPTLSKEEWIKAIKQLGMMHILYWKVKEDYNSSHRLAMKFQDEGIRESIRRSCNVHSLQEQTYRISNTESSLIKFLSQAEEAYKLKYNKI